MVWRAYCSAGPDGTACFHMKSMILMFEGHQILSLGRRVKRPTQRETTLKTGCTIRRGFFISSRGPEIWPAKESWGEIAQKGVT